MGHSLIALSQFWSGAAMLGAWVAGVFFLRFWSKTRERLFLIFGFAFWIMALERLILAWMQDPSHEDHTYVYLIRLVAFLLILYAIADKNLKDRER